MNVLCFLLVICVYWGLVEDFDGDVYDVDVDGFVVVDCSCIVDIVLVEYWVDFVLECY